MIALIIPFMALAALGFLASLAVHVVALTGHLPPGGERIFVMHAGVFVIWFPAVFVAMRLNVAQPGQSRSSQWNGWKQMLGGCPPWMTYAAYGLFGYAFLNFFLAMGGSTEHASKAGLAPQTLRQFSGHWMLFYGLGFAILYSAFREPWRLKAIKCPAGHPVTHSDKFCPACGAALPNVARA
jgi:hypothetical protein